MKKNEDGTYTEIGPIKHKFIGPHDTDSGYTRLKEPSLSKMKVDWLNEERITTIVEIEMFASQFSTESQVAIYIEGLPSQIIQVQSEDKGITIHKTELWAHGKSELTIQFLGGGILHLGEVTIRKNMDGIIAKLKKNEDGTYREIGPIKHQFIGPHDTDNGYTRLLQHNNSQMIIDLLNEECISTIIEIEMFTPENPPFFVSEYTTVQIHIEGLKTQYVGVAPENIGRTYHQIELPAQQKNKLSILFQDTMYHRKLYLGEVIVRKVINYKVS